MNLHLYYVHLLIVIRYDIFSPALSHTIVHGRYTRNINEYQLTIPRKLTSDGLFLTFDIPHFFEHDFSKKRRKRETNDDDMVNYGFILEDVNYHIQMWPNHGFLAPNAVFETRSRRRLNETKLKSVAERQLCHFTGYLKGHPGSRVALSTCDGLSGYIQLNGKKYFIEPLLDHVPNKRKQLIHVIHKAHRTTEKHSKRCGTSDNWEDAWHDILWRKYRDDPQQPHNVTIRGMESAHRYLETLIVCDKKFLEYHKNTDYELYVLTIMNMVADFYHDASSGNQMDVVVVRVMYLDKEEEEIDLDINPNAENTLDSFCKWQVTVNPKDVSNPHHHDIAVLITRHDICAENVTQCGLMGLAFVGTPCTGDKPCAINEDGGLVLSIVVAHEMGHVMGCAHDTEQISGCKSQDENKSFYVMAPYVHIDTVQWSSCSRKYMTTLFDNNLGECLNDEPSNDQYKYKNVLAGTIYDATYQCRISFPNSTSCPVPEDKFCNRMMCKVSEETCMTNSEPLVDGTKCGENKWCYRRKCVEMGQRPEAVNGGWGEWGKFSECSRTCGGGVEIAERDCNNPVPQHKGRYCLGERRLVKICNTKPCPKGSPSYREMQCRDQNKVPFNGQLFNWTVFFEESSPCALYCLNQMRVFAELAPAVKDGTKCKKGTKNMCVGGVCRKVGCDWVLDSDTVDDECGICNGDGTQCKITEDTFGTVLGHGYVKVVTVPKGARNIIFEELRPSDNTIAAGSAAGNTYYLNGDFSEKADDSYEIGGAEGIYTHPEPNKEHLIIYGPLMEDVTLYVVFYTGENVGYHYKYAEPTTKSTYQPHYHWEFVEWGECTSRCGGGVEIAQPNCLEEKAGKVTPSFCNEKEKPEPMKRKCSEQPCKTKWRVGKWGPCKACKYKSGVRTREVECVREAKVPGDEDVLIEDKECEGSRPGTQELCNSHKKCDKKKRFDVNNLPENLMRKLWLQTLEDPDLYIYFAPRRRPHRKLRDDWRNKKGCGGDENESAKDRQQNGSIKNGKQNGSVKHGKENPLPNAGTIVVDKEPPDEIKLIVVPLKQSHLSLNLSDSEFETVGDKVGDSVDFSKEKTYKGEEAVKELNRMKNHTQQ